MKHTGGLGGNSNYKSYPKWIKDEIAGHSLQRSSQRSEANEVVFLNDSDSDSDFSSDDSLDKELRASAEQRGITLAELEQENFQSEQFHERTSAESLNESEREAQTNVLLAIYKKDGEETDLDEASEASSTENLANKLSFLTEEEKQQIKFVRERKHLKEPIKEPIKKSTQRRHTRGRHTLRSLTPQERRVSMDGIAFNTPQGVRTRFQGGFQGGYELPENTLNFGRSPIPQITPFNQGRGNSFVRTTRGSPSPIVKKWAENKNNFII